jgi:UDP-3-O-[3-hydroxymyristoyl] glucosamine N-acyltransferase
MTYSVKEIAAALGAEAFGAVDLRIARPAEPASAGPRDLALAMTPAYGPDLARGHAIAAVVWPGADWQGLGLQAAIVVPRARLAMARMTQIFDPGPEIPKGVHPTAVIDPAAMLGDDVCIGPFVVIGARTRIGDGTRIAAHATVAEDVQIGDAGLILSGVRIGRGVRIGARVTLQPNAVIGGDGFSFVTEEASQVERVRATLGQTAATRSDPAWHRIHSLGGVEIGDDVEIGANSAVDAGTIRATRIGSGTKIDNFVQVAHNVVVGVHCLLCAQAAIAGSSTIGDRVVLGGRAGIVDNISVGDDVVVAAGSVVLSNVPKGRVMMGYPATRMESQIASYKALRRLPRILRDIAATPNRVSKPDQSD